MQYKSLFSLLFLTLLLASCASDDDGTPSGSGNANANDASASPYCTRLEFPRLQKSGTQLVVHLSDGVVNYAVEWDKQLQTQHWSCYEMYDDLCESHTTRYEGDPQYPEDPDCPTADLIRGSGYDHGHICPSADRLSSAEINYQTFYLTNMQPQYHLFNGYDRKKGLTGVWCTMENAVRSLASNRQFCDTLYICKGGTVGVGGSLSDQVLQKRSNRLIVPGYFFVALLRVHNGQYNAIGLLFKHKEDTSKNLAPYAMSIDELEEKTGFDFFCNLPDARENVIEKTYAPSLWGFR